MAAVRQAVWPGDALFDAPRKRAEQLRAYREIARAQAQSRDADARHIFAMSLTAAIVSAYWTAIQADCSHPLTLTSLPDGVCRTCLDADIMAQAQRIGSLAARLTPIAAGYHIGDIYTAMLPDDLRERHGIYYTPPPLTARLLTLAEQAGADWARHRVLDIACGGGAFLTPVALAMVDALRGSTPGAIIAHLVASLRGYEIDPFSAWLSHVLLEAAILPLCRIAGRRLPYLVSVCDSLEQVPEGELFDVVIGNPPYGRVSLPKAMRARYQRSLYGHANLYAVFTDLSVRWTRPGGIIALVTPASFLGGQYFKNLRRVLAAESPPHAIDLITARKDVFADVLQETVLVTYRRGAAPMVAPVHILELAEKGAVDVERAGSLVLPADPEDPWVLPRTATQTALIERLRAMPRRLRDYGYQVSTGPLVWNRRKQDLRTTPEPGCYPLIWAEAVTQDGAFVFRASKKNHQPYFQIRGKIDDWLLTRGGCVLVQRTTSKEQARRLIAAELPPDFLAKHEAVVVENHLNMVRPVAPRPTIAVMTVAAVLNSATIDQVFRCISGSVAVSATELAALPMPNPEDMGRLDTMVLGGCSREDIDKAIHDMYLGGDDAT